MLFLSIKSCLYTLYKVHKYTYIYKYKPLPQRKKNKVLITKIHYLIIKMKFLFQNTWREDTDMFIFIYIQLIPDRNFLNCSP